MEYVLIVLNQYHPEENNLTLEEESTIALEEKRFILRVTFKF